MEISWFIPTTGDGRYLGSKFGSRVTDLAYLGQIAQAVDHLGYHWFFCQLETLARISVILLPAHQ